MFLHVSVIHSVHGGTTWPGTHPPRATPPRPGTPPGPGTPPRADTPSPGTRYIPLLGADTPQTRYTPLEQTPPRADTPQDQVHPQSRHPPGPGTPPEADTPSRTRYPARTRYTPLRSRHPPEQSMLGDTVNVQAVCILLECNLVSHYNVFAWDYGKFKATCFYTWRQLNIFAFIVMARKANDRVMRRSNIDSDHLIGRISKLQIYESNTLAVQCIWIGTQVNCKNRIVVFVCMIVFKNNNFKKNSCEAVAW